MANSLYTLGKEKILSGDVDWLLDTVRARLIYTPEYTVNLSTDEFLSDVPVASYVGSPVTLASKTVTGGIARAADTVFAAVSGNTVSAVVIYVDTGLEASSPLIAYYDAVSNFPVTPSGGDIRLEWNDINGLFFL